MAAAATVVAAPAFDHRVQGSLPIRLGASILEPAKAARWTAVRYNQKPPAATDGEDIAARISPSPAAGQCRLKIRAGDGEYVYKGKHEEDEDTYILVFHGSEEAGREKELVLERLSGKHGFNLVRTPSEQDATVLLKQHPQLPDDDDDLELGEDDLVDDDADAPPEESNPFDWRHFLKPDSSPGGGSACATPPVKPVATTTTTASGRLAARSGEATAATVKRRKPPVPKKSTAKRVRAGEDPLPAAALDSGRSDAPSRSSRSDLPALRLERRTSTRRDVAQDDSDSGELILENETPVTEKPRSAMALALAGQLGAGPISLRSAAGSPAGRILAEDRGNAVSPEQYTFDLGGSSPEPELDTGDEQSQHARGNDAPSPGLEIVEDEEDDADVEDLALPSPARHQQSYHHRHTRAAKEDPSSAQAPAVEEDDDDFDLEGQLAEAFGDDDPAAAGQESEESEEE